MSVKKENVREVGFDGDRLLELIIEKNKRVQDLERQVEDQKRLREQDSSQVERKANQIKEWVTKKLKELENQNKQLRDENKKQKELIDSLSSRLDTMKLISSSKEHISTNCSPSRSFDQVQFIDQNITASPIDSIDLDQPLKARRPQLKHKLKIQQEQQHSSNELEHNTKNIYIKAATDRGEQDKLSIKFDNTQLFNTAKSVDRDNLSMRSANTISRNIGVSLVSISQNQGFNSLRLMPTSERTHILPRSGKESPLYDTVNIDLTTCEIKNAKPDETSRSYATNEKLPSPPPLPLHQADIWERQLYDLAERTFSSLTSELEASCKAVSERQQKRVSECKIEPSNNEVLSSNHTNIDSFLRPSFTTIDGEEVFDDESVVVQGEHKSDLRSSSLQENQPDHVLNNSTSRNDSGDYSTMIRRRSDDNSQSDQHRNTLRQNLFSPMRSRSGTKDNILRTQSVKKSPTPEKLYQFISSDLVKRGYLLKHGALRSHHRWILLKEFHLYSYKRESDELNNLSPSMTLKLNPQFKLQALGQNNDGYPFKLNYNDKQSLTFFAETTHQRDEWIKILTVAINLSNTEPACLTKENAVHEGMLAITRQGHSKRCHAVLMGNLVFFLKSPIDPAPLGYISLKDSKIREVTDNHDNDLILIDNNHNGPGQLDQMHDCSLAIYPRYSLDLDPIYITLPNQQEADQWYYHLSLASGSNQASGTKFERALTSIMLNTTVLGKTINPAISGEISDTSSDSGGGCVWRDNPVLLYSDKPITNSLTSLPNETLKLKALELFKSIQLFTQVHIEPVAIDYHVCLLQNCFKQLLKYPELKNEFYAQLIKQSTYIQHRCFGSKLSSSSSSTSGCSSINQRISIVSLSPSTSDCQLVTNTQLLDAISNDCEIKHETRSISCRSQQIRINELQRTSNEFDSTNCEKISPPSGNELLQVMQIVALVVSFSLPRGRLRCWLTHHLRRFADAETEMGKYALFALKAFNRTLANGPRDNIPSRTEIMSVILRNPHDHSTPHSLPVNFEDGSYLIVGADGSTTVEEFMISMSGSVNIRPSQSSDFYLFANDPDENQSNLHILEPQRKILDVVSWWEQAFKQKNSGRYQNTRVIKIYCKKRLVLRREDNETDQERLLIVHQLNREVVLKKIPINNALVVEIATIMTQLTFGDFSRSGEDFRAIKCVMDKISANFLPQISHELVNQVLDRWKTLNGRTALDCVRVYLNCIRKMKL